MCLDFLDKVCPSGPIAGRCVGTPLVLLASLTNWCGLPICTETTFGPPACDGVIFVVGTAGATLAYETAVLDAAVGFPDVVASAPDCANVTPECEAAVLATTGVTLEDDAPVPDCTAVTPECESAVLDTTSVTLEDDAPAPDCTDVTPKCETTA